MPAQTEMELTKEISELMHWMSECGEDPEGGISRFLYSNEWIAAQKRLESLFFQEGLTVQYDEVGNLFGKMEGSKYPNETILTGSHIDTVKNGGLYDGQYGIVAGFLAIKHLKEMYGQPLRNIEVVSIAEEEGSRFPFTFWGSKNIVGRVHQDEVKNLKDKDGKLFVDAMEEAGFNFRATSHNVREDLKAFVELHVEQGKVLEIEKKTIGIVQNIVGQRRFTIELTGEANHAGTTPMKYRKDTLSSASHIIHMINTLVLEYGGPLVATVGKMEIEPNISNVIPRKTTFTLDIRHTEKETLSKFTDEIVKKMKKIARQADVLIDINMWMDVDPVPMDQRVVDIIKNQCEKYQINYKLMNSGAGHDSQIIAAHVPTAMIFTPSHKGISHSPYEYTRPEDLVEGLQLLINTLYDLAYSQEEILQ
ncbi:allantoate deiminase [Priestia megaterium]|uniref:allantoate deiminase n=1 Tax=Priestia megaterium TaxID=1404 RepID=UPI003670057A